MHRVLKLHLNDIMFKYHTHTHTHYKIFPLLQYLQI